MYINNIYILIGIMFNNIRYIFNVANKSISIIIRTSFIIFLLFLIKLVILENRLFVLIKSAPDNKVYSLIVML